MIISIILIILVVRHPPNSCINMAISHNVLSLLCCTKLISIFLILKTPSRYERTLQKSDFSKLINLFDLKCHDFFFAKCMVLFLSSLIEN